MCASDFRWLRIGLCALLAAAMPALAQTNSREAEQLRRLRLQVQQLQQQASTQQQAVQQASAERTALQTRFDASQAELKALRARLAEQTQAATQGGQSLEAASQRSTQLDTRIAELQATLETERAQAVALRAELAQTQQRRGNLSESYATLGARHRVQGEGLQTCMAHNERLRALGLELLQRYERKTVAEVLAVDEPFLQWGRASLENLVQGYREKLDVEAMAAPR